MYKIKDVLINNNTISEQIDDYIYSCVKNKKGLKYEANLPFAKEQFTQRLKEVRYNQSQLEKLKNKPILKQRSEEWYKARTRMLTASDTFDGIRKVKNLVRKKALQIDEKISSYALYWGVAFEPVAISIYSKLNNDINVHEFGLIPHDTMDNYGASPDGITDMGVMVEIKCPLSRKIIKDEIPEKYMAQMQGQMAVCNLKECDYCEFKFAEIDVDEYLKNSSNLCGVLLEREDGTFMYSDLDSEPKDELMRFMSIECKNKIFWRLDCVQIIRVDFNETKWDSYYVPRIKEFWNEVFGFDEELYQQSRKPRKKSSKIAFVQESDDEKECKSTKQVIGFVQDSDDDL